MIRVVPPRVVALALALLFALAVYRVSTAATTTSAPPTPYTWHSALDEVRAQVEATVAGMRMEILHEKATYTKMWNDTRVLEERLGSPSGR